MTDISYIVSAYDRPEHLLCCLASLQCQTHREFEIIVTDNSLGTTWAGSNHTAWHKTNNFKSAPSRYLLMNELTCFHSANKGAEQAEGEFLCFPSDDSYYVPDFGRKMIEAQRKDNLDFVYCNMVYDSRCGFGRYEKIDVEPRLNSIDKTGFLIRRSLFTGFPRLPDVAGPASCDGYLVDALVASGIRIGKVNEVLLVHN